MRGADLRGERRRQLDAVCTIDLEQETPERSADANQEIQSEGPAALVELSEPRGG